MTCRRQNIYSGKKREEKDAWDEGPISQRHVAFLQFANATVDIANEFDHETAQTRRKAWDEAG